MLAFIHRKLHTLFSIIFFSFVLMGMSLRKKGKKTGLDMNLKSSTCALLAVLAFLSQRRLFNAK